MVVHVQNTHTTGAAMMSSTWLRLRAVVTEGIVFKVTLLYKWIAAPYDIWRCSGRSKCSKTERRKGGYSQNHGHNGVENSTKLADWENNGIYGPYTTTCTSKKIHGRSEQHDIYGLSYQLQGNDYKIVGTEKYRTCIPLTIIKIVLFQKC